MSSLSSEGSFTHKKSVKCEGTRCIENVTVCKKKSNSLLYDLTFHISALGLKLGVEIVQPLWKT